MSRDARSLPVARATSSLPVITPRHLKKEYVAAGELVHVETRATKLYYFPGPILALLVMFLLDYSSASALRGWSPVPFLTSAFGKIPNGSPPIQMYVMDLLGLITAAVAFWLFIRYLQWIRTIYVITDHRVIIQRGIAMRDVDDVPMNQVRGVDVHQTVGQRILGYGTIRISAETGTAKSIGNEDWRGIPKPFQMQRTIESVMQNPSVPGIQYPQQPAVFYSGPPPNQPPPYSPPPR
ncbi:MAG: PH domain-containing protein [Thermoplasmata archaeon]|nr:PH domain-containing protein [Thermoplasmata archaeon]